MHSRNSLIFEKRDPDAAQCVVVDSGLLNEENPDLNRVLREYAEYFQKNYKGKFQLTVVLNGCRDNTIGVVRGVEAEFPDTVNHMEFAAPIGKGGALIEGLKPRAAGGFDWLCRCGRGDGAEGIFMIW